MKIKYNGMELETITEGYWPGGVTLVGTDNCSQFSTMDDAVILRGGRALSKHGTPSAHWRHWAILPSTPAHRRLTNREAFELVKKGWDVLYQGDVARAFIYPYINEDKPACEYCEKLRAPGSDEWRDPTTELLEEK